MSKESVGRSIRDARESSSLTQQELADQMSEVGFGWTQATVFNIEAGRRRLTWEEGVELRDRIGFDTLPDDSIAARDAQAYRRILDVIGRREAQEVAS